MANNTQSLTNAKVNKKDEFYTTYEDIEKEMILYKQYLNNKIILLPCDTIESNFFKYFKNNFVNFNLKKIICIGYNNNENSIKVEYDGINLKKTELSSNGDFRNKETLDLFDYADVVITNPPFSLFREFIDQIKIKNVKYIIIGDINAITTKSVWDLIKNNKMWLGKTMRSGDRKFYVPEDYPLSAFGCGIDKEGKRYIRVKGVRWFTNIEYENMYDNLILTKKYNPTDYPKFDNCNEVISIDKTKNIPYDYDGLMAVPITFFDKYNPKQFQIIGMDKDLYKTRFILNNKKLYARIIIKKNSD